MSKRTVHICDWCGKEARQPAADTKPADRWEPPEDWGCVVRANVNELLCVECMMVHNAAVKTARDARYRLNPLVSDHE